MEAAISRSNSVRRAPCTRLLSARFRSSIALLTVSPDVIHFSRRVIQAAEALIQTGRPAVEIPDQRGYGGAESHQILVGIFGIPVIFPRTQQDLFFAGRTGETAGQFLVADSAISQPIG